VRGKVDIDYLKKKVDIAKIRLYREMGRLLKSPLMQTDQAWNPVLGAIPGATRPKYEEGESKWRERR
jgi:hypothetical protein